MTSYQLEQMFETHLEQVEAGSNGYVLSQFGIESSEKLIIFFVAAVMAILVVGIFGIIRKKVRAERALKEKQEARREKAASKT